MKPRLTALLAVMIGLCGCSRRISYTALSAKIDRDAAPSITYTGSDQEDHHFHYISYAGPHFFPQPIRTRQQKLKVPRDGAAIRNEFALTDDESMWTGWRIGVYGRDEFDQAVTPAKIGAQQDSDGQARSRSELIDFPNPNP